MLRSLENDIDSWGSALAFIFSVSWWVLGIVASFSCQRSANLGIDFAEDRGAVKFDQAIRSDEARKTLEQRLADASCKNSSREQNY